MNWRSCLKLFAVVIAIVAQSAASALTLQENNGWKVDFTGILISHNYYDTTRSFFESIANNPVQRDAGKTVGRGRYESSIRYSRFGFSIFAPEESGFKLNSRIEWDFAGKRPETNADQTAADFRIRHAYVAADYNGWTFLAGQSWTLFGWQPNYFLTTVSPAPGPAIVYQRAAQLTTMKVLNVSELNKIQLAASLTRASQRDAGRPNLDVGARYTYLGRKASMTSSSSLPKIEPTSVAVSATTRRFIASKTLGDASVTRDGFAVALNALVPVISPRENETRGGLTALAGFSDGRGHADSLSSFTGNFARLPSATYSATEMEPGQGGFDSDGRFQLLRIQAWNAELQYHLPMEFHLIANLGYGQVTAYGLNGLGPVATGSVLYDRIRYYFLNVMHDFKNGLRVAAEYSRDRTGYVDGVTAADERYIGSVYFRF